MPAKKVAATQPVVIAPEKISARKKTAAKLPAAVKVVAGKVSSVKAAAVLPSTKTAAKKTAAKKIAVAPAEPAAPVGRPAALVHPTRDQVAHAAYLNFLRRKQLGLAGDSASDWHAAERQLGWV